MYKNINKKSQSGLVATILSLLILTSSAFFVTNITLNGSVISEIQFNNSLEKIAEIEIWADTIIGIEEKEENIQVFLTFDNKTALPGQEIEFYLNESLIDKKITDSEGIVNCPFNFSNESSEIYSIVFQGNSTFYLNPSSIIIGNLISDETNQILVNETNQTLLNETNITIPQNLICEEFREDVLWSSGYSLLPSGSINYEVWYPKYNCTELGVSDCFIEEIKIKTRFIAIDLEDLESESEGYVQISEPDNSICDNPKKGKYLQYLANEILIGEDRKMKDYCGKKDCEIESFENYGFSDCYGIKIYGDQYMITDVFEVTYNLCYEKGGENA